MSVCSSTATATQYTTIAASTVLTSLSYITTTLPAGTTTLTSSICAPQPSGGTTAIVSCRTFTTVSSLDGGITTVQVPIAVTVTTTSLSPLSTLYSTTCTSTKTAAGQQTTAQTTVSTTTVSAATASTTGHHRSSAVATVTKSSAATSAAAVNASSSNLDNTGVIVGAAVGGGIGLILVALLGWFLCHRRHRDKGDYIREDKLNSVNQGQLDGNAMVRPTPYPYPYPYRGHSKGSDYFSARPGRPKSYRKTVPAFDFDFDAPQAQTRTPSATYASPPPAAASRSGAQTGSRSVTQAEVGGGNVVALASRPPGTIVPTASSAGRPHARQVASEGTSNLNLPQRGHRLRSGEVVGLARSPPLAEKDRFYLHPDRGLTVMRRGEEEEGAQSGPSAQGNAPSRKDDLDSDRRQESRTRGGGETGGQEDVSGVAKRRDRQGPREIGGKRQSALIGIARSENSRRMMDEHGGEESEAPPAYWE